MTNEERKQAGHRKCWYKEMFKQPNDCWSLRWKTGWLLTWGLSCDDSNLPYTAGIIETQFGEIETRVPERIRFTDPSNPPGALENYEGD